MTDDEIVKLVERNLFAVAPEFEGETIDPETDYPSLETLKGCISYLKKRTTI